MSAWWIVCVKELRETLRDRRTLLMMVVVPVLLYPVLLIVSEQLLLLGMRNLASDGARVAVMGEPPPELLDLVEQSPDLDLVTVLGDPERAIRLDSVSAIALFGPPAGADGTRDVTVLFDAVSDRSQRGHRELNSVLGAWRDTLLALSLIHISEPTRPY